MERKSRVCHVVFECEPHKICANIVSWTFWTERKKCCNNIYTHCGFTVCAMLCVFGDAVMSFTLAREWILHKSSFTIATAKKLQIHIQPKPVLKWYIILMRKKWQANQWVRGRNEAGQVQNARCVRFKESLLTHKFNVCGVFLGCACVHDLHHTQTHKENVL